MASSLDNDSWYDYTDTFMPQHSPMSISSLAIFSLSFVLGLLGNGMVIWIITLKMKRTVNTIWFLHLAIADFICCLSLPFPIVQLVLPEHWPLGWFFCKLLSSAIIFNMFASVFLLTTISIDRCLLVMKPIWCQNHRTVRCAALVCGGVWLLALVMSGPAFFYRETVTDDFGNTKCIYNWYDEDYAKGLFANGPFSSGHPDVFPTHHPTVTPGGTVTDGTLDHQSLVLPNISARMNRTEKNKTHHFSMSDALLKGKDVLKTATTPPSSVVLKSSSTQPNTTVFDILPSGVSYYFWNMSHSRNSSAASDTQEIDYYDYFFPEIQVPTVLISITITRSFFGFLFPFGIMLACYTLIAHKMFMQQFAKSRRKAFQVILFVIAAFFLCWAPYHIVGILYLLATPGTPFYKMLSLWDHISVALAYVNSCINPILYVFVGQNFREKACQTLQGVLEVAFKEEATSFTTCSQDRSKTTVDKDIDDATFV